MLDIYKRGAKLRGQAPVNQLNNTLGKDNSKPNGTGRSRYTAANRARFSVVGIFELFSFFQQVFVFSCVFTRRFWRRSFFLSRITNWSFFVTRTFWFPLLQNDIFMLLFQSVDTLSKLASWNRWKKLKYFFNYDKRCRVRKLIYMQEKFLIRAKPAQWAM